MGYTRIWYTLLNRALLKSTTGVPSLSLPDPTPSLIFLLTSLCAVQSERLEQESERLEQASVCQIL